MIGDEKAKMTEYSDCGQSTKGYAGLKKNVMTSSEEN